VAALKEEGVVEGEEEVLEADELVSY